MIARVQFSDVSLTDGQTVTWSGALSTAMAQLPLARMAGTGLAEVEVISTTTFSECLARGEDPWQRVTALRAAAGPLVLRARLDLLTEHGGRGADVLSPEVGAAWIAELAARGVAQVVIVDPLLQRDRLRPMFLAARRAGVSAVGVLPYDAAERRTDAWYCTQAAHLVADGAERVMLRDEAGVLTVDRIATLFPLLLETLRATPLQLHTRCQTALAPQVVIEAVRLGVAGIDTALPCVANGASVPSLTRLVRSLALLGVDADVPDMASVAEADAELARIADAEGLPAGAPWVFDVAPYVHQLPGEIAAQAMDALTQSGQLAGLHAFAEECARVRAEVGNPPMVAPFAGPIAAQAWQHFNGMARYAELQPGLRRILLGAYGPVDGAFDRELQQRVGALGKIECKSLEDIRRAMPLLDDASRLLAHAFAANPSSVPRESSAAELTYRPASPWDRLALGLLQRSQRYALLSVTGPGVDIRLHQCKE